MIGESGFCRREIGMKKINANTAAGFRFLGLALCAFAGLGIELPLAFTIEPLLYGTDMQNWSALQSMLHSIITCVCWGAAGLLLIRIANHKCGFNIFEGSTKMEYWQWFMIAVCFVFRLITSYIDWDGFKIIKEYEYHGLLKFIFQYLYYFFETILFTLIIVFAQKAFEFWFKKSNFPYGGIAVALTWGLGHIFTKGSLLTGLLSALVGFIFGTVYLMTNRNIKKTIPILFIMFVI